MGGIDFLLAIREGGRREDGGSFGGQVELGVIHIAMEINVKLSEDLDGQEAVSR